MKTEFRDIDAILDSFQRSSATELLLSTPEFELRASKRKEAPRVELRGNVRAVDRNQAESPASSLAPVPAIAPIAQRAARQEMMTNAPQGHAFVKAANLGTFYRAPKPGAPPYVNVGDTIAPDDEVCLIEVMKMFTPLRAGVKGVVREILVDDSSLVEFDQRLFLVELHD